MFHPKSVEMLMLILSENRSCISIQFRTRSSLSLQIPLRQKKITHSSEESSITLSPLWKIALIG